MLKYLYLHIKTKRPLSSYVISTEIQKYTEERYLPQLECRKGKMTTIQTRPRITSPTLSGVKCYWDPVRGVGESSVMTGRGGAEVSAMVPLAPTQTLSTGSVNVEMYYLM